jgi:hypothetical protein
VRTSTSSEHTSRAFAGLAIFGKTAIFNDLTQVGSLYFCTRRILAKGYDDDPMVKTYTKELFKLVVKNARGAIHDQSHVCL